MIISNNALKLYDILPTDLVVRVNVAWSKNFQELHTIIENATHPIYLDYPTGRTKPPKPTISLEDVIMLANHSHRVKYFAFSNAEDPIYVTQLREKVNSRVQLVPKIETVKGVENLVAICKAAQTDMVMLDHEDLYVNVNHDSEEYNKQRDLVFKLGVENKIKVYIVQGIIFDQI